MADTRIPEFMRMIQEITELHLKKNEDYASDSNPFDNFDCSEYMLKRFKNPRDQSFIWPIATKLARLGNLLSSNSTPNNESINDSLKDIAVYCLLWAADIERRSNQYTIIFPNCESCGQQILGNIFHYGQHKYCSLACSLACISYNANHQTISDKL